MWTTKTYIDEVNEEEEDTMEQDDSSFDPSGEDQEEEEGESDSGPSAKTVILDQSIIFTVFHHYLRYIIWGGCSIDCQY